MIDLNKITGFNWDGGNARKNDKQGVSTAEAEQVFFNAPLLLMEDGAHSQQEPRLHALGQTDAGRTLHITCTCTCTFTFTLRQTGSLIRVISARDMHRKERAIYEQAD